jgi:hypothetical protein
MAADGFGDSTGYVRVFATWRVATMGQRLYCVGMLVFIVSAPGCQEARLRDRTVMQAATVNEVYYAQALNNLAMMEANPGANPYFALPSQGTNQNQNALTATYTPNLDLITAAGHYLGRWLFDKNTTAIGGTVQNAETWQTAPTTNPDKINLLKLAYLRTMGREMAGTEELFTTFKKQYPTPFDYYSVLSPGWYFVGTKKDVPKDACAVGHCGKTYVWVLPEHGEELSRFSLAILNIVTISLQPGKQVFPAQTAANADELKRKSAARAAINRVLATALADPIDDKPTDVITSIEGDLSVYSDATADAIRNLLNDRLPARTEAAKKSLRSDIKSHLEQAEVTYTTTNPSGLLFSPRDITQSPYPAPPSAPSGP